MSSSDKTLLSLLTGAAAGLMGGFFGVGGGIIMVPMMVGLLKVPQHQAQGTSLAVIIPLALAGVVPYILNRDVEWPLVFSLALGSFFGAIAGARLMARIPQTRLRQGFGLFVVAVAIRLLVKGIA